MKKVALIGNPNSGKTTLFNSLTGSTCHVGNWPGVTVEKKEGIYKKIEPKLSIIDLPGIYSLSPYTDEEVITRNYLLNEKPDCIINIVDATNIERNLYLTTQLMEIDIPMVVALNMIDEVNKNQMQINTRELEKLLQVPVIKISALKNTNIDILMTSCQEVISHNNQHARSVLKEGKLHQIINSLTSSLIIANQENPLFYSIKLLENDELVTKKYPEQALLVNEFKNIFSDEIFLQDLEGIIIDERYKFISNNVSQLVKHLKKDKLTKSDKIDRVLTNKYLGIPIFLLILLLIFHLTFSENLFFLGGLFESLPPNFEGSIFEGLFYTSGGINSPGVIFTNLLNSVTGWISNTISSWFPIEGSWEQGLIVDGVVGGIFAVLGFLPQILTLFLLFSILEDTGYMARVAFILDRIFRRFGLSGRAFMPMIMGFGCSVPAMINTRTLLDEREKIATIRVIPFFSCGARNSYKKTIYFYSFFFYFNKFYDII